MRNQISLLFGVVFVAGLAGCGSESPPSTPDASSTSDASNPRDASTGQDAATGQDASGIDAAATDAQQADADIEDATQADAATGTDATPSDAVVGNDAEVSDIGGGDAAAVLCNALTITATTGIVAGTTEGGSDNFQTSSCTGAPTGMNDVLYQINAPGGLTRFEANTAGTSYNTTLSLVLAGATCAQNTELACNNDNPNTTDGTSLLVRDNLDPGTYFAVVDMFQTEGTYDYQLQVSGIVATDAFCDPSQPYITCQSGRCAPAVGGGYRCRGPLDCNDGIDTNGNSSVDEDGALCSTPPTVGCPANAAVIRGDRFALNGTASSPLGLEESGWIIASAPAGSTSTIEASGQLSTGITPSTAGTYVVRLSARDTRHQVRACETTLTVVALIDCDDDFDNDGDGQTDEDAANCSSPPLVTCGPPQISTPTGEVANISGSATDTGSIVLTRWTVRAAPTGNAAVPVPADNPVTTFTPILGSYDPDHYALRLTAVDNQNQATSCEVQVQATVADRFRVELVWNPTVSAPSRPSDLDLHLIHPDAPAWFDTGLDCYSGTCTGPAGLSWGPSAGPTDDPTLSSNVTSGRGPEIINIATRPTTGTYRVGVHYVDPKGSGTANAVVNIWCNGARRLTTGSVELVAPDGAPNDPNANPFWRVADVRFTSSNCFPEPLNGPDGPDIITGAQAKTDR